MNRLTFFLFLVTIFTGEGREAQLVDANVLNVTMRDSPESLRLFDVDDGSLDLRGGTPANPRVIDIGDLPRNSIEYLKTVCKSSVTFISTKSIKFVNLKELKLCNSTVQPKAFQFSERLHTIHLSGIKFMDGNVNDLLKSATNLKDLSIANNLNSTRTHPCGYFPNLENIDFESVQINTDCFKLSEKMKNIRLVKVEFMNGDIAEFLQPATNITSLTIEYMAKVNYSKAHKHLNVFRLTGTEFTNGTLYKFLNGATELSELVLKEIGIINFSMLPNNSLKTLHIENTELNITNDELFVFDVLEELKLKNTATFISINSIPEFSFSSLTTIEIEKIECVSVMINNVLKGAADGLAKLTLIDVGFVDFSMLPNNSLNELYISESKLNFSTQIAFGMMDKLEVRSCTITNEPADDTFAFPSLYELTITDTKFDNNWYNLLSGELTISLLYLKRIDGVDFAMLPNKSLESLHISDSNVSTMTQHIVFEELKDIYLISSTLVWDNVLTFSLSKLVSAVIANRMGTQHDPDTTYRFLESSNQLTDLELFQVNQYDATQIPYKSLMRLDIRKGSVHFSDEQAVFEKLEELYISESRVNWSCDPSSMFRNVNKVIIHALVNPNIVLSFFKLKKLKSFIFTFDFKPRVKSYEFGKCLEFFHGCGLVVEDFYDRREEWRQTRVFDVECSRENIENTTYTCKTWLSGTELSNESEEYTKPPNTKLTVYVFFAVLYTILVIGLVGNLFSAYVLIKTKMWTARSGIILLGLTFSDFLVILTYLCNAGFSVTLFYEFFIQDGKKQVEETYAPDADIWLAEQNSVQAFVLYPLNKTGYTSSVYMTVFITLERFFAVCYPLKVKTVCSLRNSRVSLLVVFFIALLLNFPRWIESYEWDLYAEDSENWNRFYKPTLLRMPEYARLYHKWIWSIVMYAIPFLVIGMLNFKIVRQMRIVVKARKLLISNIQGADSDLESLTKMLLTVVAVFVVCNSIHICIVFYFFFAYETVEPSTIEVIAGLPLIINSSVNVIIYVVLGKKFRHEFVRLIPKWLNCCLAKKGVSESSGQAIPLVELNSGENISRDTRRN